ncbi:hypothetical protein [Sulfitobacter pontiacus]|uniref:hypothetical protein n=1 Tax=Sulfitobacter pontiacus TaxID=60137 RepID=UPI0021A5498F|nr:hypothetical protein [Sulfitobacter pontiacus]UWR17912.1 hypothetical protein K3755_09425 [Sulfitobacter pontiacus]
MFNSVKSIALATGVSLAALSSAAFADDNVAFSAIDVSSSIDAAQDANAMEYYPQITEDLKAAVAARVLGSDDASDPTINIDIRKISLDGDTMLSDSQEFNEIEGVVDITSPNESIGARSFPVNVAAYSVDQVVPEGYVAVAPTEGVFYEVMINGFADEVAEQVGNLNTAGSGVSK